MHHQLYNALVYSALVFGSASRLSNDVICCTSRYLASMLICGQEIVDDLFPRFLWEGVIRGFDIPVLLVWIRSIYLKGDVLVIVFEQLVGVPASLREQEQHDWVAVCGLDALLPHLVEQYQCFSWLPHRARPPWSVVHHGPELSPVACRALPPTGPPARAATMWLKFNTRSF